MLCVYVYRTGAVINLAKEFRLQSRRQDWQCKNCAKEQRRVKDPNASKKSTSQKSFPVARSHIYTHTPHNDSVSYVWNSLAVKAHICRWTSAHLYKSLENKSITSARVKPSQPETEEKHAEPQDRKEEMARDIHARTRHPFSLSPARADGANTSINLTALRVWWLCSSLCSSPSLWRAIYPYMPMSFLLGQSVSLAWARKTPRPRRRDDDDEPHTRVWLCGPK